MQALGEASPVLETLETSSGEERQEDVVADLQVMVQLLPSVWPSVTRLLLSPADVQQGSDLPDMSLNNELTALDVAGVSFSCDEAWLRLPPNLKHLACKLMETGPPTSREDGGAINLLNFRLKSLESITFQQPCHWTTLPAFARLLRAAPGLRQFGDGRYEIKLALPLPHGSTAASAYADMAYLSKRLGLEGLEGTVFHIERADKDDHSCVRPFFTRLPQMTGLKTVRLSNFACGDLGLILRPFRDAVTLTVTPQNHMDNAKLQAISACSGLERLCLSDCVPMGPDGLLALCRCLPSLKSVQLHACRTLNFSECAQLLALHCPNVQLDRF